MNKLISIMIKVVFWACPKGSGYLFKARQVRFASCPLLSFTQRRSTV